MQILDYEKKPIPQKETIWAKWSVRSSGIVLAIFSIYYLKVEITQNLQLKELITLTTLCILLCCGGAAFAIIALLKRNRLRTLAIIGFVSNAIILAVIFLYLIPYFKLWV